MAATQDGGADVYSLPEKSVVDLLAPPQDEPHSENLGSATFSSDGDLAAVTDENSCRLWEFRTGSLAVSFPKDPGQWLSARFAPDGRRLWLCGWDLELTSHDLERDARGALTVKASPPSLSGHGFLLRDMSADGHALLLGHDGRGEFVVLQTADGSTVSLSHPGALAAAISPDASWAVTSSYKTPGAKIWSLPDGSEQRLLCAGHTVMQALIMPDAHRLILRTSGENFSFRTTDWTVEQVLPSGLRLTSVTASPDGRFLATLGDAEVRLHDARTFQEILRLQLPDHTGWLGEGHPVFDADGSHLLIHTALGSAVRWNLHTLWKELERLGMGM
jgi:WD40 repeat protein